MNFTKFSLLALVLFFAACKKDPTTDNNNSLVGTWNLTEETCNDGVTTTSGGGQSFTGTFTSVGKDYATTVTFNSDGTFTSGGSYTATVTTNFLGQIDVRDSSVSNFAGSGKWKLNGTTLTVTDANGTTSTAEVLENTAHKFRYKIHISVSDTSTPGVIFTDSGTYFFTLTK
jgi:hypothetical protein